MHFLKVKLPGNTLNRKRRYVFGLHLNYDPSLDSAAVEKDAEALGDYTVKILFRRHARVWLKKDYGMAVKTGSRSRAETYGTLAEDIALSYDEAIQRDDVKYLNIRHSPPDCQPKGCKCMPNIPCMGIFFP